ncbi:type II toxin-antitoxin system ParD family antitoxin [Novosphingopyxis sp.]|uniref:type II toxin-antitoxin system ParD family antitoxin n=1 Tax=Novosphingopyxis sp. TaxID=2709690 RepID=UPI003B5970E1
MAATSLSLGSHFEAFVRRKVESGQYRSVSEVVRAGLRELEDGDQRFSDLRAHVAVGVEQADRGEFVENFRITEVIESAASGG